MYRYRVTYVQDFQGKQTQETQDVYARDLKSALDKWSIMCLENQKILSIQQIHSLKLP